MTCRSSSSAPWRRHSGPVVAELCEHPGTEDDTEAGLAAVDLNVRVLAKTLLHLPGQHLGLVPSWSTPASSADALAV